MLRCTYCLAYCRQAAFLRLMLAEIHGALHGISTRWLSSFPSGNKYFRNRNT
jgi:hypothetical protein